MNTQKGFASILIILLGLVVIGGGTYFYIEKTTQPIKDEPVYTDINEDEISNIDTDTTNNPDTFVQNVNTAQNEVSWKTYGNQDLAFSLQIPDYIQITERVDSSN